MLCCGYTPSYVAITWLQGVTKGGGGGGGGGYRSRSTRFEKKINARTSNLLFRFPTALTRLKKNRERFDRCENQASKEEEVSRTRSRPSLSVCLFHITHILPERDYSSRGQKFRAPPLNRHPVSPRDILLDYNSRKTRRSR